MLTLFCVKSELYISDIYDANASRQSATEINMILFSIQATGSICIIFPKLIFYRTIETNDCSDINDTWF